MAQCKESSATRGLISKTLGLNDPSERNDGSHTCAFLAHEIDRTLQEVMVYGGHKSCIFTMEYALHPTSREAEAISVVVPLIDIHGRW